MRKILFFILICNQSFGQPIAQELDSLMLKKFPKNQQGAALLVSMVEKFCIKKASI